MAAPDLPAHGTDTTPARDVTLDSYVDRVVEAVDAQPGPVVLVGHSMGGMVITETAERRSEDVATLVYLAAFLPRDGQSLADLAGADDESVVTRERGVDEAGGVMEIAEADAREVVYGECAESEFVLCRSLYRPELLPPLDTPVETTDGRFGSVPRAYVHCERDRAITPTFQREMREALPCEDVVSLDTDHAAQLSALGDLASALVDVGTGE